MPRRLDYAPGKFDKPGDQPGFYIGSYVSPKYSAYMDEEILKQELLRSDAVQTLSDANYAQIDALRPGTPDEIGYQQMLRGRAAVLDEYMRSDDEQLQRFAIQGQAELWNDIDTISTHLTKTNAEYVAGQKTRGRQVFTQSVGMRDKLQTELAPYDDALAALDRVDKLIDTKSPYAAKAVAYNVVQIWQAGTGSRIADADLQAAESSMTAWAQDFEAQLAKGVSGEGFIAEQKKALRAVLSPFSEVAAEGADRIIGRYETMVAVDSDQYDHSTVFSGLDSQYYRQARLQAPAPMALPEGSELIYEPGMGMDVAAGVYQARLDREDIPGQIIGSMLNIPSSIIEMAARADPEGFGKRVELALGDSQAYRSPEGRYYKVTNGVVSEISAPGFLTAEGPPVGLTAELSGLLDEIGGTEVLDAVDAGDPIYLDPTTGVIYVRRNGRLTKISDRGNEHRRKKRDEKK